MHVDMENSVYKQANKTLDQPNVATLSYRNCKNIKQGIFFTYFFSIILPVREIRRKLGGWLKIGLIPFSFPGCSGTIRSGLPAYCVLPALQSVKLVARLKILSQAVA
jgi:hypothetical protein